MEELIISLDLHSLSKENTCAYMLLWMGFLTQSDSNLTRVILESDSSQNFDSIGLIEKPSALRMEGREDEGRSGFGCSFILGRRNNKSALLRRRPSFRL